MDRQIKLCRSGNRSLLTLTVNGQVNSCLIAAGGIEAADPLVLHCCGEQKRGTVAGRTLPLRPTAKSKTSDLPHQIEALRLSAMESENNPLFKNKIQHCTGLHP